jgi:hypothetical protein
MVVLSVKVKEIWKKFIPGVIVTVIAGIIIEIGKIILNNLPTVGSGLIKAISDYVYQTAAEVVNYIAEQFILVFMISAILIIIITCLYQVIQNHIVYKKFIKTVNDKKLNVPGNKPEKEKLVQTKKKQDSQLELDIVRKGNRSFAQIAIFILCIGTIFLSYVVITFILPISMKIQFEKDITLIAPYTSAHQIEILKSEWVQMKNQNDYSEIYVIIDGIIEEYSLEKVPDRMNF